MKARPIHFLITTPCLNYARMLDQTVLAVLEQGGDFILHYHVQDGGSTDGTLEKLAFWQTAADNGHLPLRCRKRIFTVASGPDTGVYDAVNRGFAALTGGEDAGDGEDAVMAWINAGDLLVPGALAAIAAVLRQYPATQWVCGRRAYIDEEDFLFFLDDELYGYPRCTLAAGLHVGRRFQWIQPEGMVWRQSLWNRAGKAIDSRLRLAGDWDLWRRFAAHAEPLVLDRVTGVYRFHEGRLSEDMARYLAEVDAVSAREGLEHMARAIEADFIALAGRGDIAGLYTHGFSGAVARYANGTRNGAWNITRALPCVMPEWEELTRWLAGSPANSAG